MIPKILVQSFVGDGLQGWLEGLNLMQHVTHEPFSESNEEYDVLGVDITISYLPIP